MWEAYLGWDGVVSDVGFEVRVLWRGEERRGVDSGDGFLEKLESGFWGY